MFSIKNLEAETITADTLAVDEITTESINGLPAKEFSYIKGLRGNLQDQLTNAQDNIGKVIRGWQ